LANTVERGGASPDLVAITELASRMDAKLQSISEGVANQANLINQRLRELIEQQSTRRRMTSS